MQKAWPLTSIQVCHCPGRFSTYSPTRQTVGAPHVETAHSTYARSCFSGSHIHSTVILSHKALTGRGSYGGRPSPSIRYRGVWVNTFLHTACILTDTIYRRCFRGSRPYRDSDARVFGMYLFSCISITNLETSVGYHEVRMSAIGFTMENRYCGHCSGSHRYAPSVSILHILTAIRFETASSCTFQKGS